MVDLNTPGVGLFILVLSANTIGERVGGYQHMGILNREFYNNL